jgi:hypothetical protein
MSADHSLLSVMMSSLGASSSLASSGGSSLNFVISKKLTRDNFLLWQAQVLPEIYGAQLFSYLDGLIEVLAKEVMIKDKDGVDMTDGL